MAQASGSISGRRRATSACTSAPAAPDTGSASAAGRGAATDPAAPGPRARPCHAPRLLPLAAALVLTPQLLSAQVIRGTVVEEGTGTPIANAEVLVRDTAGAAVTASQTDDDGRFSIELEEYGTFVVRFRHLAYLEVTSRRVDVRPGEEVSLQVRMSADAVALEPVTVTARRYPDDARLRDFYERAEYYRATGRGRILMRDDIEAMRPVHTSNILNTLPARSRCATIYVDGLLVDDARFIDSIVGADDIEGIEVYSDRVHIPLQFQRRDTQCAILIWRRPYGEGGKPFRLWRLVAAGAGFAALILLLR